MNTRFLTESSKIQYAYLSMLTESTAPSAAKSDDNEPDNTEFTGEEEDWILGASENCPKTLDPKKRDEYRKKYYGESADGEGEEASATIEDAIVAISDICEKHNAVLGNGKGNDGTYTILFVKIKDTGKEPGVGFNMNYIMGVGNAIESDMKEAGINGFVGAGGYLGNSTKIHVNTDKPFISTTGLEESEGTDEFDGEGNIDFDKYERLMHQAEEIFNEQLQASMICGGDDPYGDAEFSKQEFLCSHIPEEHWDYYGIYDPHEAAAEHAYDEMNYEEGYYDEEGFFNPY